MKRVLGILVLLLVVVSAIFADLNDGPIAYYPFNGNANDESGNGHDGTVHGSVPFNEGVYGKYVTFDGDYNNYIQIPHHPDLNFSDSFSISVWIKKLGSGTGHVISKGRDVQSGYCLYHGGRSFNFRYGNSSNSCYVSVSEDDFSINIWHQVTIVADNNNHILNYYLDGSLMNQHSIDQSYNITTTYPLIFGRHFTYASGGSSWPYPCNASIDEVRIYNRALSDEEIKELYFHSNFEASVIISKINSTIQFTDKSTSANAITSWAWDFDNDGVIDSNEQNPTWSYSANGTYTVSLTISDGTNTSTETKTDYINIVDNPPDEALVAYYPFNGNANDEGCYGNDATVNGATLTTDRFGNENSAYYFDGSNDYIDCPDGFADFTTGFTLAFWTYQNNFNSWERIIDFGNGAASDNILFSPAASGYNRISFQSYNGGTKHEMYIGNMVDLNTWSFFVAEIDNTGYAKIYKNGVLIGSQQLVVPNNIERHNNYIGKSNWGGDHYYAGKIDELRIYNRTLTVDEIKELYFHSNFEASTTVTKANKSIQFTDTSTSANTITSWAWDFDNDGIIDSNEQNPTWSYSANGTYTITLTISDGTNTSTETKTDYIKIVDNPLEEGLVAYYPFNGNADDESGNGNDGTVNGATLIPDRFGNENSAYNFDGSNDYISVPNSASLQSPTNAFSFSGWININNWYNNWFPVFAKSNNGSWGQYSLALHRTNGIQLSLGNYVDSYAGYSFELNTWYYITVKWDGNSIKYYVNGEEIAEHTYNGILSTDEMPLEIGRHTPGSTEYANGLLDDFRFYNRAISEDDIKELYFHSNFEASVTVTRANKTIQFTDTSTSANTITSWAWDFDNDGVIDSNEQNPTWSYSANGTYTVTLTISDGTNTSTETKTDYIKIVDNPLEEGLVAYYPFNGNANDESGNGYNGTVNGATLTTDRFDDENKAYYFNSYLETIQLHNEILNDLTNVSTSFWVKTGNSSVLAIVSGANSSNDNEYLIYMNNGKIKFHLISSEITSNENISDNKWHNIIITRNSNTGLCKVYIDGTINSSEYLSLGFITISPNGLWIGNDQDNVGGGWQSNNQFHGILDDFRFYNRVLSEDDINEIYYHSNFEASTMVTRADRSIQFTDISTSANTITSWAWDFDNDGVIDSNEQNPTWSYTSNGTYTVTLTISDGTNTSTETKTDYIKIVDNPLEEGLVAYYPFNSNANDESGNGYNGTVNGATLTTDRFDRENNAYFFDSYLETIQLHYEILNNLSNVSTSFWLKTDNSSDLGIVSGANSSNDNEYLIYMNNGKIKFHLISSEITSVENISDNKWHNIIVTRHITTGLCKIYIDGVLESSQYMSIDPLNISPNGLWIGNDQDNVGGGWQSNNQFHGILDDFRFYNRALCEEDIKELYFHSNFTVSNTAPKTGEAIQFTDTSTSADSIVSWQWDFDGDGTIDSNEQNPSWTYYLAGNYNVTLTITDGTNSDTITKTNYINVTLNPDPVFCITPTSMDFGTVRVNTSSTKQFTVTNYGQNSLTVFIASEGCFDVTTPTKTTYFTLNTLESQDVNVTFTPDTLGDIADSLNIISNDSANNPYIFYVSGRGGYPYISSPQEGTTVDCGSAYLTSTTDNQLIVVENTGEIPLVVNSLSFTEGTNSFNYIYDNLGSEILPGETDSIYVNFSPTVTGVFIDSLQISNNSENKPSLKIEVKGTGLDIPPHKVENVQITMNGLNAQISWDPVTTDIYGNPMTIDYYLIYRSLTSPYEGMQLQGYVAAGTTEYSESGVGLFNDRAFYYVTAYKNLSKEVLNFIDKSLKQKKTISKKELENFINKVNKTKK